jgi:oligopeptide transport system ATP-binding protein
MSDAAGPLLEVEDLTKVFRPRATSIAGGRTPPVHAVDGVSFTLGAREALALVGESGSGKTTIAKLLLDLERPTSGHVRYKGVAVAGQKGGYRSAVQAVFQDPSASLDPRRNVRHSVTEPLVVIHKTARAEREKRLEELLELVGLDRSVADSYPHELSGGMQQRVAIARALAPWPSVLILDEPVSSLDVSIKAQVMNLLKDLRDELDLSYVLIAHDLATVRFLADRVAVLYLGRIVELGQSEDVFQHPLHPYTQTLLTASAVKRPGALQVEDSELLSDVGSASNLPSGCRFHPRCPWVFERCPEVDPALERRGTGHPVACIAYDHDKAIKNVVTID